MQPPLKRLSTGTGQQEGQRMQDVDENFGRLETEVDLLNANASLPQGTLANNTDLDNVISNGVWYLAGSNTYPNKPSDIPYGILIVNTPNNTQASQRIVGADKSVERYRATDGWRNWR